MKKGAVNLKKVGYKSRNIKRYKRYAQHRDARGLTDYYIASRCLIPKSTFTAWKKGESTPNVDSLMSICKELGVSISELIGDE